MYRTVLSVSNSPGGRGRGIMSRIRGLPAGQGMVFGLSVRNRVYDCPKQGMVTTIIVLDMRRLLVF